MTTLPERLLAALKWYVENDETMEGDEPLPDHHGATWNEINAPWLEGKRRAIEAIEAALLAKSAEYDALVAERDELRERLDSLEAGLIEARTRE